MIYLYGSWEWCGVQAQILKEKRAELLKMSYIDQESMCRIAEIGRHLAGLMEFGRADQIQDVTEKSPLCEKILNEPFPDGFQLPLWTLMMVPLILKTMFMLLGQYCNFRMLVMPSFAGSLQQLLEAVLEVGITPFPQVPFSGSKHLLMFS